jgi:hypothetical protein
MIPDFKTFIKESIWSDIQDRSAGDTVRKEDEVNHLDQDDFLSYLENKYKVFIPTPYYSSGYGNESRNGYEIELFSKEPSLNAYINVDFESYKLKSVKIDYHDSGNDFRNKFLPRLNDNFDVEDIDDRYNTYLIIKSKTGEINNKVVTDIFDLVNDILDNDKSINADRRIDKKSES